MPSKGNSKKVKTVNLEEQCREEKSKL